MLTLNSPNKISKSYPNLKLTLGQHKMCIIHRVWLEIVVLFYLRFNNIKVIAVITLADDIVAGLNLPLEHGIQDLVHLRKQIGYKGVRDTYFPGEENGVGILPDGG